MDRYQILVDSMAQIHLVDTRLNNITEEFAGRINTKWSEVLILTDSISSYSGHFPRVLTGPVLLGYSDGSYIIINRRKGDYIPPGYISVTQGVRNLLDALSSAKYQWGEGNVSPLEGEILVNKNLTGPTVSLEGSSMIVKEIIGWSVVDLYGRPSDIVWCKYGLKTPHGRLYRVIQQTIPISKVRNVSRIHVHIKESSSVPSTYFRKVTLNHTVLSPQGDGHYIWVGRPFNGSPLLQIQMDNNLVLSGVEITL